MALKGVITHPINLISYFLYALRLWPTGLQLVILSATKTTSNEYLGQNISSFKMIIKQFPNPQKEVSTLVFNTEIRDKEM